MPVWLFWGGGITNNKQPEQEYIKNENVNLAIYLNEEETNSIPSKEGNVFDEEKSTCTNDAYIVWDYSSWSPIIKNVSNYPVRCNLYFKKAKKFTITYNLNGGEGNIESQEKEEKKPLNISKEIPTKQNYTFIGWSTSQNGTVEYLPGAEFNKDEDTTLYAVYGINELYNYGNQYIEDTGGWKYVRTFTPSLEGSTTMKENDVAIFGNTYLEWKEIEPTIGDLSYYGEGHFITTYEIDLSNAKAISFEYEILLATSAIAPSNQVLYYPEVNFYILNNHEEVVKYFSIKQANKTSQVETATILLNDSNLKNAKIMIQLRTVGTSDLELHFRLYRVYVTY